MQCHPVLSFLRLPLKVLTQRDTEILHTNPYWRYKHDRYELPSGREADYWYAHTFGSVFVIAEVSTDRFILTRQFRYLNQDASVEFPGGGLAEGIEPLAQAQAELEEEAGYTAQSWTYLGEFNPMNGLTNERCKVFLATELVSTTAKPEESEEIEVFMWTRTQIEHAIAAREIWDGMTLAAWALYCFRRS